MSLAEPFGLNTDIAVLTYGGTALALTIVPTYLWHTVFKNDAELNQVGFKVSAYSSFYFWLPVAILTPFYFLIHSIDFFDYFLTAMKLSAIGPWIFGLLSLYYLF